MHFLYPLWQGDVHYPCSGDVKCSRGTSGPCQRFSLLRAGCLLAVQASRCVFHRLILSSPQTSALVVSFPVGVGKLTSSAALPSLAACPKHGREDGGDGVEPWDSFEGVRHGQRESPSRTYKSRGRAQRRERVRLRPGPLASVVPSLWKEDGIEA